MSACTVWQAELAAAKKAETDARTAYNAAMAKLQDQEKICATHPSPECSGALIKLEQDAGNASLMVSETMLAVQRLYAVRPLGCPDTGPETGSAASTPPVGVTPGGGGAPIVPVAPDQIGSGIAEGWRQLIGVFAHGVPEQAAAVEGLGASLLSMIES